MVLSGERIVCPAQYDTTHQSDMAKWFEPSPLLARHA